LPKAEVATTAGSEIEVVDPALQALLDQQDAELVDVQFNTPILKLAQPLTREVSAGDAEAGEFINTLTGESLGDKVEVVIAAFQKGRAASGENGRYFVCVATDTIPESWSDLVGPEWVGTPFSEYPDAEEQYKERVNSGEIEWGKGPKVSTTYVYTVLVLDEEGERQPVRLSLLRSTKKASDKILTLKRGLFRAKPFWDKTFELQSAKAEFGRNTSYIINVKLGRDTDPDEKAEAVELATAVFGGRVADNADVAEAGSARVEPEAKGALAV
jgi:hypothetical protein